MNAAAQTVRLCRLALLGGREEACAEDCPLWENGACSLDQLTDDGELHDGWLDQSSSTPTGEERSEE